MTKEEEILAAAEEEFFKNGFDAASTAVIAKRAGVTHAMVNYYFRTKERLFVRILDNHVFGLLQALKPLMQVNGNVADVATEAASVIFDMLNEDRMFPFLIMDIMRSHPDFLLKYKETFDATCLNSIAMHAELLEQGIASGQVQVCTMKDIYDSVLSLSTAPFMLIPLLENVAGMTPEKINVFLQERKKEMLRILRARYGHRREAPEAGAIHAWN